MTEKLDNDQCAALKTADWTFHVEAEIMYSNRYGKSLNLWLHATDDDEEMNIDGNFEDGVFTTLKGTALPPVLADAFAASAASGNVEETDTTGADIVAELRATMPDEIED